jgi:hypothetical protein
MTKLQILAEQAQRNPSAVAIAAPGRLPLSYGTLPSFLGKVVLQFRGMGV